MTLQEDKVLLDRIKRADEQAFHALFDRYWKPMTLSAYRRILNEEDAKDMVQEILISIWQRRDHIETDAEGSLSVYLFSALKYRVINYLVTCGRKDMYQAVLQRITELQSNNVADNILSKELQQVIDATVAGMSPRMQQAFRLSRYKGLSIREIANELSLSEQTVKNLITQSLQQLRRAVHLYYNGHPGMQEELTVMAGLVLLLGRSITA